MHSRIYELSTKKIEVHDRMTEYDFSDNGFVDSIATYVSDIEAKHYDEEIKEFIKFMENVADYNPDDHSLTFRDNSKQLWFKQSYDVFKEEVTNLTLDKFCDSIYRLETLLNDRYNYYIYHDYYETIDSFMRNAAPNVKYYIGGVLDYHY